MGTIDLPEDILPEGHSDPMLMSQDELAATSADFAMAGNVKAASFLMGVLYSRASLVAAGVNIW